MRNVSNIIGPDSCYGCAACKQICPQTCIQMAPNALGFLYPSIQAALCTDCGQCLSVCPSLQCTNPNDDLDLYTYACVNKCDGVVKNSSSGGLFYAFAESVLEQGGVVFGAAFDDSFLAYHTYIEDMVDIDRLMRSKYMESRIEDSYTDAKRFLDSGRRVLFVGTPCQIGGLRTFLQKDYQNLLAIDFICGSNYSPFVWRRWLSDLEKKCSAPVTKVNLRSKVNGWQNYTVEIELSNNTCYSESTFSIPYLMGAFSFLYSRESCFHCKFTGFASGSDITWGDFWGGEKAHPDFFDDAKGMSVCICNTDKGLAAYHRVSSSLCAVPSSLNNLREISFLTVPRKKHVSATRFFSDFQQFDTIPVEEIINKYISKNCRNTRWRSEKYLLGIVGGYNSRAQLLALENFPQNLVFHFDHSSILSLMASPIPSGKFRLSKNSFRAAAIQEDLEKSFYLHAEANLRQIDCLLIDLTNEMHDLFCFEKSCGTISEAFSERNHVPPDFRISRFSSAISSSWKSAFDSFVALLLKYLHPDQIVVNKVLLSEKSGSGGRKLEAFPNRDEIRQMNRLLESYYTYFVEKLPGAHLIALPNRLQYSDLNHKWGCKPEHLNQEAYQFLADALVQIIYKDKIK